VKATHVDYKVRVPIYFLIFAIYLKEKLSDLLANSKEKRIANWISKGRVEVLIRLVVT
jgi:hypothetical protein